jgi:hypothetical protein
MVNKSFGCSKCRFSKNGCAKCRNEDSYYQPKALTKEQEAERIANLTAYELEREVRLLDFLKKRVLLTDTRLFSSFSLRNERT